ncbi:hypothetical protein COOONC_27803 [Cooperia oncophora]
MTGYTRRPLLAKKVTNKRTAVKAFASAFDPLGLLTPDLEGFTGNLYRFITVTEGTICDLVIISTPHQGHTGSRRLGMPNTKERTLQPFTIRKSQTGGFEEDLHPENRITRFRLGDTSNGMEAIKILLVRVHHRGGALQLCSRVVQRLKVSQDPHRICRGVLKVAMQKSPRLRRMSKHRFTRMTAQDTR